MEQALGARSRNNPPALLAAYAVGFSLVHLWANMHGWYYAYSWLDIPMHVGGGIWVAWAAYAYKDRVRGYAALPVFIQALGVLAFVALVGVAWELWEAFLDAVRIHGAGMSWSGVPAAFNLPPYDLRWDTLLDLVNDLLGAVAVSGIWLVMCRNVDRKQ